MNRKRLKEIGRTFVLGAAHWNINKKICVEFGPNVAVALSDLLNVENMLEEAGRLPKDDWFFQSIDDVTRHTGLSRREQETVYAKLRVHKFIEQINKGQPRRRWFRIDWEVLNKYLLGKDENE